MSIKTSMPVQPTSARRMEAPSPSRGGSTIRTSQPAERLVEARVMKGPQVPAVGSGSNIVISQSGALSGRLFLPPEVDKRAVTTSKVSL